MKTKILFFILMIIIFIAIGIIVMFNRNDNNEISNMLNINDTENINNIKKNNTITESEEQADMETNKIKLIINDNALTATLENNSSTRELLNRLAKSDITIEMSDYGNMEKVGLLDFNLPRNDENISTNAGDLILYQGNSFVIYYDQNTWNLTRLGKIDNISQNELKRILGEGDITVVISLY